MTVKYNSVSHDVLVYAKMMRRPFSAHEPMIVFARMDRLSKVQRSIDMLIKDGLLKECPDGRAEITQLGIDQIYLLARKHGPSVAHSDS